jgi:hypothetical protein|tara:strand:+ start:249 stop:776 length:528 start_codon:yes stop_codon:yes gene_type:complete
MITDRISLNLIYIHLDQFQSNQGPIDNIQISVKLKLESNTKTINFSSLENLNEFINQFAPLTGVSDIACFPLRLFELKSFNTVIDFGESSSNKNTVINNERVFTTTSNNIDAANLDILNKSYMPAFIKVMNAFDNLTRTEYILDQNNYIDCNYIQVYFEEQLVKVIELYKKYKNR